MHLSQVDNTAENNLGLRRLIYLPRSISLEMTTSIQVNLLQPRDFLVKIISHAGALTVPSQRSPGQKRAVVEFTTTRQSRRISFIERTPQSTRGYTISLTFVI